MQDAYNLENLVDQWDGTVLISADPHEQVADLIHQVVDRHATYEYRHPRRLL